MTAPAEPVEPVDGELAALDAEEASLTERLAQVEVGRDARLSAVTEAESALAGARSALWEAERAGDGGRERPGPHGAQYTPESDADVRQRQAAQRRAELAVALAEQQTLECRRTWTGAERQRSDLLMSLGRLRQRRYQLERERAQARRAAAAAGAAGDLLAGVRRRLGLTG